MIMKTVGRRLKSFLHNDQGSATIPFVIVVPVFFFLVLMVFESGNISLRQVMLERGVDLAVRDVRIGLESDPTAENMKENICEYAGIIPDCLNQLEVELIARDPRAWATLPTDVKCISRSSTTEVVKTTFDNVANNQLMFLLACVRFDPVAPTTGIGRTIVESNTSDAADGSYALVALTAFVVEPYQLDEDEGDATDG